MPILTPREIPTVAMVRELLDYFPQTGDFHWRGCLSPQTGIAGSMSTGGYWMLRLGKNTYRAHRIAWLHFYGVWPAGFDIDHINGIRLDNRIANLRLATRSQNNGNSGPQPNNFHGIKGATFSRGKWQAQLMFKGKNHYLGRFNTAEEANAAYLVAAKKFFGEFARAA